MMKIKWLRSCWGLLVLACLGTNSSGLYASHFMGMEIQYECLDTCNYRIRIDFHTGCGSVINQNPTFLQWVGDSSNCILPSQASSWTALPLVDLTPLCAPFNSDCDGPGTSTAFYGELSYFCTYNVCGLNCTEYELRWGSCCRNQSLSNVVSTTQNLSMGSVGTRVDLALRPCNNSPVFCRPNGNLGLINRPTQISCGAHDADGDSLAYRLADCRTQNGNPVLYNSGYSLSQLLGPNYVITLDSLNGNLDIIPQPGGSFEAIHFCIKVDEYRGGIKNGEVTQEFRFAVANGAAGMIPPVINGVQNITGGYGSGFHVFTCPGNSLAFEIPVTDANGDTLTVWWDEHLAGGTFVSLANASLQDTFISTNGTARFSWVAPTQPGLYAFCMFSYDRSCPSRFFAARQITIHVGNEGLPVAESATVQNCLEGSFAVSALQGTPPFSYAWNGTGGLSQNPNANDSTFTHTFPGPGNYPWSVTVTDSNGCSRTLQDTLQLDTLAIAATATGSGCLQVDYEVTPAAPGNLYTWSGNGGLSTNPASGDSALVHLYASAGSYFWSVTVTDSNGCQASVQDTLELYFPDAAASVVQDSCLTANFSGIASGGTGPLTTLWILPNLPTISQQQFSYTFPQGGSYPWTFEVTDSMGCTLSLTGNIQIDTPVVPTISQQNDTLTSSPSASYQWFFNGSSIPGATTRSHIALQSGVYQVTTLDSLGCEMTSDTVSVTLVSRSVPSPERIKIYPNPGTGLFRVEVKQSLAINQLVIRNPEGKVVKVLPTDSFQRNSALLLDLRSMPRGLYLMEVEGVDFRWIKKLVLL